MNRIKKKLSALISGMLLIGALPPIRVIQADAASVCTINTNKTYQTIKGFGGMNIKEWTGYNLTDAETQRAFGNGSGELGMSILRIYVNDNSSQWSQAIPVAKKAQELGATVFATPWNPPESMRANGNGKPRGGKYVLKDGAEAQYAKHLNDFIKYCEGQGVKLKSVAVQNEPDWSGEWTYWSPDRAASFIANYGKQVTNGTNAMLMSPESFSYSKDYYNAILNNPKAYENCGIFGTHFYGTQRSAMDFPALENCGKDIWMTEVYCPDSKVSCEAYPESLEQSVNIHNGLVVGNMNAYVVWYIKRSYGPLNESGQISKRGYCMAQYSKYVRPGDVRIDATEQPDSNILVSAYKHSSEQIEIVAINNGTGSVTQQFTVDNRAITNVDRYRTSSNENIAQTKGMDYSGSSFYAQLPSKSISTFVVSLTSDGKEVPADPDQPVVMEPETPDENGYYFHDTFEGNTSSWTGHGSADVTLSGRSPYQGGEALLIQNREKSWNGAQKALSSNAFKAGETYSFSACATYLEGNSTQGFKLSLQYTDANGETKYDHIAEGTAVKGNYLHLANTNYKLPDGGKNFVIYVETDDGTENFYVDEVIGAVAGTKIDGPPQAELPAPVINGDITRDERIDSFDVIAARQALTGKAFASNEAEQAADVNGDGEFTIADAVLINEFVLGKIKEFPQVEIKVDNSALEAKFSGVKLATSYKADNENNPLISQYFGADPGTMEYNGRVYVYMTDDHLIYDGNNVKDNNYGSINCLRCISSDDMVNWTDHGLINVAGSNGIAKWAGCSWAPTACHKTINGKEKFFLYFANNANGIGVLTSDSPTGPWTDPNGKALISRSTANCTDVTWVFDPAVLVDDDGTGYLYFGGGVPEINGTKQSANPKTARVVKLGADMVSLNGTPQLIDAPYLFEDSGVNKINGKYYYSYCSNWSTGGNSYGLSSAAIEYMVSDSPMGPFTYKGEVFKNIGNFFGTVGNNHHTIQKFGNDYYLFYHAQYLQDKMGIKGGYRSTHVDKLTVKADGTISAVTGTKAGMSQLKKLNPFVNVEAETLSHQGGITISGSGNTIVNADKGDWFKVSGVDCGSGAKSVRIKAYAPNGAVLKICTGSTSGKAVAYVDIPAGSAAKEYTAPVSGLSGVNDLFFIFSDTATIDNWNLK
ncbi:MAG: family 43 glycosylhydrolase [Ruminococcus sp.]|nr:family 43 glycosylhydrolase [Ruminococcus sp.]